MKSAARFYVVQALFQMEAINQDLNEIKEEFENFRIGAELDGIKYNDADKKYFRKILDVAVKNQSQIDRLTDQALVIDMLQPLSHVLRRKPWFVNHERIAKCLDKAYQLYRVDGGFGELQRFGRCFDKQELIDARTDQRFET